MAYFNQFPKILYDVKSDGKPVLMTNLLKRVRMRDSIRLSTVAFDYYDVGEQETPEYVAGVYYGDPELHWIVLYANSIVDVYTQWPMSTPDFERYVKTKYDDINAVHHYEITQESGDTTKKIELPNDSATSIPVGAVTITNYEYETRIQEEKRRIRLVQPRYVERIKKEFRNKISE